MTVKDVLKEWMETNNEVKRLESLLNYYDEKYGDAEVNDYKIEGDYIHIELAENIEKLTIKFKLTNGTF